MLITLIQIRGKRIPLASDSQIFTTKDRTRYQYAEGLLPPNYPVPVTNLNACLALDHERVPPLVKCFLLAMAKRVEF